MTSKELNLRENAIINAYSINNKEVAVNYLMALRELNTRKTLYRFRPPRMYEVDALQEEKIYLCRPSQYEDYNDCKIEYDLWDLYRYYILNKYPKLKHYICIKNNIAFSQLEKKIKEDPTFQKINEAIRNECLIACVSESCNSYMWDTYAQNCEGICFEYEMDTLITGIEHPLRFFPVRYVDDRSKINDIKFNSDDVRDISVNCEKAAQKYMLSCLTKNKIPYAQEYEWRIIYDHAELGDGKIGALFSFILPSKIILGKNISKHPNFENAIIECAKMKKIPLDNQ